VTCYGLPIAALRSACSASSPAHLGGEVGVIQLRRHQAFREKDRAASVRGSATTMMFGLDPTLRRSLPSAPGRPR
jgi:hypothetical protein